MFCDQINDCAGGVLFYINSFLQKGRLPKLKKLILTGFCASDLHHVLCGRITQPCSEDLSIGFKDLLPDDVEILSRGCQDDNKALYEENKSKIFDVQPDYDSWHRTDLSVGALKKIMKLLATFPKMERGDILAARRGIMKMLVRVGIGAPSYHRDQVCFGCLRAQTTFLWICGSLPARLSALETTNKFWKNLNRKFVPNWNHLG